MTSHDKLVLLAMKPKTSHILHLLMSVITAGFWVPVWFIITLINQQKCANIDRKIRKA